jgi:mono/diheme cytochrome c family protein
MRQSAHLATLTAVLTRCAPGAQAQDADVVAGHALARQACIGCHVVEAGNSVRRRNAVGPAFQDIANTPGMTGMALHAFLTTSHPKMPNLILTPAEMDDVVAYILSLRR